MQPIQRAQHVALQRLQRVEVLQQLLTFRAVVRFDQLIGGDHVAQFGAIFELLIQGGGGAGFSQQLPHALQWQVRGVSQILQGGFDAVLLQVLLGDAGQSADLLAVVPRQAHQPGLAIGPAVH